MHDRSASGHKYGKRRFCQKNCVIQFAFLRLSCLYTATYQLSLNRDRIAKDRKMKPRYMNEDYDEVPLSQSNVSLKLADIQRRCAELIADSDAIGSLSLEEPAAVVDDRNPYNRG